MKGHTEENHLYIHVPFCHKKCRYCDFYTTVGVDVFDEYVKTILREIDLVFGRELFSTIYLGGGTPSMMPLPLLEQIFKKIYDTSMITADAEITIEVNPEDVTEEKLRAWKGLGINRVSLGLQSFLDEELRWLGRMHDAKHNFFSLEQVLKYFQQTSVDLIIHLPGSTLKTIEYNIQCLAQYPVMHVSIYGLTIEKGTSLYRALKMGEFKELSEEDQLKQLLFVYEMLRSMGFERYEVSNFAREGKYSRHNMAYWLGQPYIGLGPSAHSYQHPVRRANISHLFRYLSLIHSGACWYEEELITPDKHWLEMLMLRLRTKMGLNKKEVIQTFGEIHWERLIYIIEKRNLVKYFCNYEDVLSLTDEGILVMDKLLTELIF